MKKVIIEMENGAVMKGDLYPEHAPITVENFEKLAGEGFYDGLTFHRVIPGFMIQGGCLKETEPEPRIYDKRRVRQPTVIRNDLDHKRGVLSMARAMDPNSAGSQFFIMVEEAPHLDGQYAAFGMITEGMDEADRIVSVDRDWSDCPRQPQVIKTIRVVEE